MNTMGREVMDKAVDIRDGEGFDIPKVEAFLNDSIDELSGRLSVKQFPGGYSNLTYMIRVGDKDLVLRRPPFGTKAKSAHDMGREYHILSALAPVFPYCPKPVLYTKDESIMGCPFYVMERIEGIILRKDLPKGLTYTPDEARRLCENLIDVHLELHSIDYKKIGMDGFGKPEGYVKRQVQGWSERYRNAKTPDAPDLEEVMAWLTDKMPLESPRTAIIHNDYKFDNVVLSRDDHLKIIGILDWEMATIGDPLMDLGASIAYWVEKDDPPEILALRMMPTDIPGALTRREMVSQYASRAGITIDNFDFYLCFGLFRIAGILQQIYYRFSLGQTKDKRFKALIYAVKILGDSAIRVIEQSDL